jgi:hypothetical protein
MPLGWQVSCQVASCRTDSLAKLVAKYDGQANYTRSVGLADPQTGAGPADEPGWSDCPSGYISLSQAARRTGFSSEWLRQLAHAGEVENVQIQVGNRTRIWLAEDHLSELAGPGSSHGSRNLSHGRRSNRMVVPDPGEERDPVADERDRWRSEALRMREAGLLMAAAFDAMKEADQYRTDAQEHMHAAGASMDKAFEKTREAVNNQNQALRQFMIPTDMLEN